MYKYQLNFKSKATLFMSAMCLSISLSANANVVSVLSSSSSGEFYIGSTTSQGEYQNDSGTTAVATSVSLSSSTNQSELTSSAFGYRDPNGLVNYGANASGRGIFGSSSALMATFDIYNDSGFIQAYTLSYFINAATLKIDGNIAGGFGGASFYVSILDAKTTIFSRGAQIELLTDGSYRSTIENMILGDDYDLSGSVLNSKFLAGTLNLGTLEAGESKQISYIAGAQASGWWDYDQCSNASTNLATIDSCSGGSSAFIGDPSGVTGKPQLMIVSSHAVNPLPLPGTLALFGLGLIGLAYNRRQQLARNKKVINI